MRTTPRATTTRLSSPNTSVGPFATLLLFSQSTHPKRHAPTLTIISQSNDLDGSHTHSQFLDHRPHRSWQVDTRRPPARTHRSLVRKGDVRPGARQHGSGTRTRHHHQGTCGPPRLQGPGRKLVCAELDRHARTRRLFLRS